MSPVFYRTPSEDDIVHVGKSMRAIDALEVHVVTGLDPEHGLRASIERADWSLAALAGDRLETQCVFGVCPDDTTLLGEGFPWLIGAETLPLHARHLLDRGRFYVEAMFGHAYQRLRNIVHVDNAASIRWLKWLGFEFGDKIDVKGHPFLPFEMARPF